MTTHHLIDLVRKAGASVDTLRDGSGRWRMAADGDSVLKLATLITESVHTARGTLLFNPYTGKPRHPEDIKSDPHGILMVEPEAPLRAVGKSS